MNAAVKNFLTYSLMLLATAFLVWFSYKNIEAPAGISKITFLNERLNSANWWYLFLSGLVAVLSHLVRAERWRLMLAPIGYPVGLLASFFSVMVGYFINLVIPRGGELARCVNMLRLGKVPVETSVGTVVAERVIDVVFLLLFVTVSFLVQSEKLLRIISDFLEKRAAMKSASQPGFPFLYVAAGLFIVALAVLFVLWKTGKLNAITDKLAGVWINMRKGLLSIFSLEKKALFLFYSLLIWIMYFMMAWLVMQAFEATRILGFEATLTVFTLGTIAMAIPTPGGAGSYHILVPFGLNLLYSLTVTEASAFTFIFHAWQTVVIIVVGLIAFVGSQLLKTNDERI